MKKTKQKLIVLCCFLLAIGLGSSLYVRYGAATKVALVNFPSYEAASIIRANEDAFIEVKTIGTEQISELKGYDAVLVFAMGLKIDAAQRDELKKIAGDGVAFYSMAATNPENNICSLDSVRQEHVAAYLSNGSRRNYQNLLKYIRSDIDGKSWFVEAAAPFVEMPSDVFYHISEDDYFESYADYQRFYEQKKLYKPDAPKVAVISAMSSPFAGNRAHLDSLIKNMERSGLNVYPISSMMKRMSFLREVNPDAVVYMPHGRLVMMGGEQGVAWLKQLNIPLFCPLTIMQPEEEWKADKMGMLGGFLSQSVVMPELDGGIYPYVVNAEIVDRDGLHLFHAMPDRLKNFTAIVNNFFALKTKPAAEKKIAVYYFKGPGQSALTASGMEVIPSLYNLLKELKTQGYDVSGLPDNVVGFEQDIMRQGCVLGTYAKGVFDDYLKNGNPLLIDKADYEQWSEQTLSLENYAAVIRQYGEAPGEYMGVEGKYLAVARVQYGNVVLLPQPMAAAGDDAFQIVHGAKVPPPHNYLASYLWVQHGFKADALIHFGTHGGLEYTPEKQVALSGDDWPDRLVGNIPHFYYYTIGNVGEGMIAKRRSYATLLSYLTPPFMESETRGQYRELSDRIDSYYRQPDEKASLAVKKIAVRMGLHRDLRLDSVLTKPYMEEEIERLENFAEEIANEKMTGQLYTLGESYGAEGINATVMAMGVDPVAYSLFELDKLRGKIKGKQLTNKAYFTENYLNPVKRVVQQILAGNILPGDDLLCRLSGMTEEELAALRTVAIAGKPEGGMAAMGGNDKKGIRGDNKQTGSQPDMTAMMKAAGNGKLPKGHPGMKEMMNAVKEGKVPEKMMQAMAGKTTKNANPGSKSQKKPVTEQKGSDTEAMIDKLKPQVKALEEMERTIQNIVLYTKYLAESPALELQAFVNALSGGYTEPSSGGDAVANPQALPTGRNLYAINAEATPSETAWENGIALATSTLDGYKKKHGVYPRKVSYTFWSSEFIETEGATIAQVLYMLGVEPVRDRFGRVSDLKLIPSEELGRPRIDVIVQTSGQFRDLAASRLMLINRAVQMAAEARDKGQENYVAGSVVETERQLVEKGIPPKEARELSTARVFGGLNGGYGTGITGMVEAGDRWENEQQIADTYLHNMGAVYITEKNWGAYNQYLLKAALNHTDVVVQPRQSNTWGALSLDHVYEFMGGMSLAVRNVTGKDPDAVFADYRNRNNMKVQDLKEAIGVEARSTIFNPAYIREKMKGGASAAGGFSEIVKNTYGWNVMKPAEIDREMWDKIYDVYVKDELKLGVKDFFKKNNPAALQEMTAVMLETARKGMWQATEAQLKDIAELQVQLIREYKPACSGFVCNNQKLRDFTKAQLNVQNASDYEQHIAEVRTAKENGTSGDGVVMKKQELASPVSQQKNVLSNLIVAICITGVLLVLITFVRKKSRRRE